jgi:hypothetical protein
MCVFQRDRKALAAATAMVAVGGAELTGIDLSRCTYMLACTCPTWATEIAMVAVRGAVDFVTMYGNLCMDMVVIDTIHVFNILQDLLAGIFFVKHIYSSPTF